jgi:hypothetical protein
MTKKQARKLHKRAHIAAAMAAQNAWIEDALGVATDSQPERHRLFAQARDILARKQRGTN